MYSLHLSTISPNNLRLTLYHYERKNKVNTIKNYEWVLDNINWSDNDEPNPYILIEGWLGGSLDYEKSDLIETLEQAIKSKEFFLIKNLNS